MDRSTPICLVSTAYTRDVNGVQRKTETVRTVYANVQSVSASEFFEGGRNGLKPEYRFVMFRHDYNDEPVVAYEGKRYAVYRTYIGRNDTIELYTEQKGGTNG
jgi:SPP1 family predicted phage head-tail adaptor